MVLVFTIKSKGHSTTFPTQNKSYKKFFIARNTALFQRIRYLISFYTKMQKQMFQHGFSVFKE